MEIGQNFRSAFNGFNREDVVHYIEYLNSNHASQINQLKSEVVSLQEDLNQQHSIPPVPDSDTLEELSARCTALEQERDQLTESLKQAEERLEALSKPPCVVNSMNELEAYRRAERTERLARDRAEQIYQQANSVLADATAQVDDAAAGFDAIANQVSAEISGLTQQIADQLVHLQESVAQSKQYLQNAAATMYTIKPDSEDK